MVFIFLCENVIKLYILELKIINKYFRFANLCKYLFAKYYIYMFNHLKYHFVLWWGRHILLAHTQDCCLFNAKIAKCSPSGNFSQTFCLYLPCHGNILATKVYLVGKSQRVNSVESSHEILHCKLDRLGQCSSNGRCAVLSRLLEYVWGSMCPL